MDQAIISNFNKYDSSNPDSIAKYAGEMVGKTFIDIINDNSDDETVAHRLIDYYGRTARKGGLGNLLEEVYFGYKANGNQEADFKEAGVELKVTPYEITQKGLIRAGERLVITMISYEQPFIEDFFKSHVWEKIRLTLLVYYHRNKELNNNLLYRIGYVNLFTPPKNDLLIIQQDYDIIKRKVMSGKAHELSESDTLYLGACTKGSTAEKSTVIQFYNKDVPARKRAFCFKNSYMTYVLNTYIVPGQCNYSSVVSVDELSTNTFEEALIKRLSKYIDYTDDDIIRELGESLNKSNKSFEAELVYKMLGVKNTRVEEFMKAGILVKILTYRKSKGKNQQFRLEDINLMDLNNERFDKDSVDEETGEYNGWEESELYSILKNRKYLFAVFWEADEGNIFKGCQLWGMPDKDIEAIRPVWNEVKEIVRNGIELKCVPHGKEMRITNNLPGMAHNGIFHIRNHASKTYYQFKDGSRIGTGSIGDSDLLPSGERMTRQAYWLNRSYIDSIINPELRRTY